MDKHKYNATIVINILILKIKYLLLILILNMKSYDRINNWKNRKNTLIQILTNYSSLIIFSKKQHQINIIIYKCIQFKLYFLLDENRYFF